MKYIPYTCLLFLFLVNSLAGIAQKKTEYTFPDDVVADTAKKSFVKQFNQGQILYNISCAQCHNMKDAKNKLVIPDFSLPQLMDYEMRLYPQHAEKLSDTFVTDVEMNKIILFLRYKKKTGVTVTPKSVL